MHWMRHREDEDLVVETKVRVADWINRNTQVRVPMDKGWSADSLLQFFFNASGARVDPSWQPTTGTFDLSARWAWYLYVARRGPLLTCETAAMAVSGDRCGIVGRDEIPRQPALKWTQEMAVDLGLKYVEAAPLRAWEVSYEDIDPEFYLDRETGRLPTAFQVLFYE